MGPRREERGQGPKGPAAAAMLWALLFGPRPPAGQGGTRPEGENEPTRGRGHGTGGGKPRAAPRTPRANPASGPMTPGGRDPHRGPSPRPGRPNGTAPQRRSGGKGRTRATGGPWPRQGPRGPRGRGGQHFARSAPREPGSPGQAGNAAQGAGGAEHSPGGHIGPYTFEVRALRPDNRTGAGAAPGPRGTPAGNMQASRSVSTWEKVSTRAALEPEAIGGEGPKACEASPPWSRRR